MNDAPLAPFACRSADSRGRRWSEPEPAERSAFQRDRDRLIHSAAFRRLQHKTQVFIHCEGDHYRTRLTHSLEVSQIARTTARALRLDEDLAEAVALAHDLGHPPFGHAGEDALNAVMAEHDGFDHNDQAVRVVTLLERRYAAFDGLNLSWEALEGVVKHNGPLAHPPPTIRALNQDWPLDLTGWPSAEAQVAALADDIAYSNHDLDDGLRAGFFTPEELLDLPVVGDTLRGVWAEHPKLEPSRLYHELTRRMIGRMISDLLAETRRRADAWAPDSADDVRRLTRPLVSFSADMAGVIQTLKAFLFARMYRHYRVNRMTSKGRRVIADLFSIFMEELPTERNILPTAWRRLAQASPSPARVVCDYIAGMTDRFALDEHQRLFDLYAKNQ